ncbi:MAG: hypothetical protein AAGF77_10335 [Bacteroidota bacterium]
MCSALGFSQRINFDQLGKDQWLRYNGGVSLRGIYYEGAGQRQPFTYYAQGNLNFNIAGLYNIPLSFTYSNQDFDFANPFNFNRLSLHPSYKWITAHIGDVNMTFSPYTLAGHQFTGLGFDVKPQGKWQISAMYGRLLRATEYNAEAPQALTAYERRGFGLKVGYDFEFMQLAAILFKATDDENSLQNPLPIELGLAPKDNAVVSLESTFRLFGKADFRLEYALSGVTEDTRSTLANTNGGALSWLLDNNGSTQYFQALNASFTYPAGNGSLGVGYERIDPNYRTFGAYFFNNDLENITLNATQSIFNNKVTVGMNAGLQRDNLDDSKTAQLQRIVSAFYATYAASEKLNVNGSYSNFQSFTNIRDQFDFINQVGDLDNVDTLNYRQISQNATLGFNLTTKKSESKNHQANLNLVYQTSDNQQDGETVEAGSTVFYNGVASYNWGFPKSDFNVALATNVSVTSVGDASNNLTWGPTLAVGKLFFEKQLRTNLSTSYNTASVDGVQQNTIFNVRLGGAYTWLQKHNFSLNLLALFRESGTQNQDFTATLGYTYTFDNLKWNRRDRERDGTTTATDLTAQVRFRYRDVTYSGTIPEVTTQLNTVFESSPFQDIPEFKQEELQLLFTIVQKQKRPSKYTENALVFLEALYSFQDFKPQYEQALIAAFEGIVRDMDRMNGPLQSRYEQAKVSLERHPLHNVDTLALSASEQRYLPRYRLLVQEFKERKAQLAGHQLMNTQLEGFSGAADIRQPKGYLKEFIAITASKAFAQFERNNNVEDLVTFLQDEIIQFHYEKALALEAKGAELPNKKEQQEDDKD